MFSIKNPFFLSGEEISKLEFQALIKNALELKQNRNSKSPQVLSGKSIALIFEKPSLRTRVSFTVGIQELGGSVVELQGSQKKNEDPQDAIRVLQGMVHGVMIRTFDHQYLETMTKHSKIPIINGLSDSHHPCQALADLMTIQERLGQTQGLKLTYIGDGNNVLHSLLLMAPLAGVDVHFCCPEKYQPDAQILKRAQARAQENGTKILSFQTPQEAASGAHALYTDVWTSMGFEAENDIRMKAFSGYQINKELVSLAAPGAIVLHCLPMQKGLEITEDVVEGKQSAIFQQAENRLHAQKALLVGIYGSRH